MTVIDRPTTGLADSKPPQVVRVRHAAIAASAGIATGLLVGLAVAFAGRWT
jgi:hypothetical protein